MDQPDRLSRDLSARRSIVEEIHAADTKLVLAVAGGGNAVITDLLDVPGASKTILEVRVPYADAAMAQLLAAGSADGGSADGGSADDGTAASEALGGAVSRETAEAMAGACLSLARGLAPSDRVIGVACTAALVSDRPKRGDHRAHVVVALGPDAGQPMLYRYVALDKGRLDRAGEDRVVADAVLDVIAEACGLGSLPDDH